MKTLLEIKDLYAGYNGKDVIKEINLTLKEKDFLGIIGPNGGGKTTLIKVILGLIKPSKGEVIKYNINGKPITIGYLPQYSSIDKKFPITVEEVVLSGLYTPGRGFKRYSNDEKNLSRQIIEKMGLEHKYDSSIESLSGGELQRALLGRSIISNPQLVILDEPNTYIDKKYEAKLYELLAEINQDRAIIIVSHDIGTILQQVKSIACVNETLDYHPDTHITEEWLEKNFQCPIEILGHGTLPHRILGHHHHKHE